MSKLSRRRTMEAPQPAKRTPSVMPAWSIWVGAGLLLLVAVTSMWALLTLFGTEDKAQLEANKVRLEIIKLSGSVVIGTGGAAALLLAARRQRSTELSIAQSERDLAYKEHDANERRATELYIAATEQLGSEKAPVRLAGLYALERFGQNNFEYRQTVVNVLCAYLRMPFEHPESEAASTPKSDSANRSTEVTPEREPFLIDLAPTLAAAAGIPPDNADKQRQEQQVRLTAQRILTDHLQPSFNDDGKQLNRKFWPTMRLDLSGATLEDFSMFRRQCHGANFRSAKFYGNSSFSEAKFHGFTDFSNAEFHGLALFDNANLNVFASFEGAHFAKWARFDEAHLTFAIFERAHFSKLAEFNRTHFYKAADFSYSKFSGKTSFKLARFHHQTFFSETQFTEVSFEGARLRTDTDRTLDVWPMEWLPTSTERQEEFADDTLEGDWTSVTVTDLNGA